MFYIHVLRIKCELMPQGDFLRTAREPIEIITRSFQAKPTANVGRGSEWHIGNVEAVKADGLAFAMGRTIAVTSPQFDSVSHDFLEEEAMRAPFTIGVFDQRHQVCGIIRKTGVSQSSYEIASKLQKLLNAAPYAQESNSSIVVDPIQDPMTFSKPSAPHMRLRDLALPRAGRIHPMSIGSFNDLRKSLHRRRAARERASRWKAKT